MPIPNIFQNHKTPKMQIQRLNPHKFQIKHKNIHFTSNPPNNKPRLFLRFTKLPLIHRIHNPKR